MSQLLSIGVLLLSWLVTLTRVPVAEMAQLNRDLLGATVRVCVAAKRSADFVFPCEAVDLGSDRRPGTALLHVPRTATHYVVAPIDAFAGLETRELQGFAGTAIFQAAWEARATVAGIAGVRLSDIGLAINSPSGRSQDHLHIHIDCAGSKMRAFLASSHVGEGWSKLPQPSEDAPLLARRVAAHGVADLNPFASLAAVLTDRDHIRQASIAIFAADDGAVYLVADIRPYSMAEMLLDHRCAR